MPFTGRRACIGLLVILAGPPNANAETRSRDLGTRVDVLLTTAPELSDAARTSMMGEAAAIWAQQGVTLNWLPPRIVRPVDPNRLRVLVIHKRPQAANPEEAFAVGELVRPAGNHAVALLWIESAKRLVASVRGTAGDQLIAVGERRLGVVLGRALAHEIGHYLLDTRTHARQGLMRPQFDALEFTDLRNGTFALDHAAAAWLRARDVEKFAY